MLVNVQLEPDGEITQIDDAFLVKTEGKFEDDNERTSWIEYRLKSDPDAVRAVHRSFDMVLKKPAVFAEGVAGQF